MFIIECVIYFITHVPGLCINGINYLNLIQIILK